MLLITNLNEYPRYVGDLKLAYPEWEEGDALPDGWRLVKETPVIECGPDELVYEEFPQLVENEYVQSWAKRPLTSEEIERRQAPILAKQKLIELGFTEAEIFAIKMGLI